MKFNYRDGLAVFVSVGIIALARVGWRETRPAIREPQEVTMGLTMHPRAMPVDAAVAEAELWVLEWSERHGLTDAEVLAFHASYLGRMAKYQIREERHGGVGVPGDEALSDADLWLPEWSERRHGFTDAEVLTIAEAVLGGTMSDEVRAALLDPPKHEARPGGAEESP